METNNRPQNDEQKNETKSTSGKVINPFENHQSAEEDIAQSKEEMEKEQQFKEAQTERD